MACPASYIPPSSQSRLLSLFTYLRTAPPPPPPNPNPPPSRLSPEPTDFSSQTMRAVARSEPVDPFTATMPFENDP